MLFFYQSPVEFYWSIVLRYPYHIEVFLQIDLATPPPHNATTHDLIVVKDRSNGC